MIIGYKMLITDEIRNRTICDLSGPLSSEKSKHYQELFALAVLRYFEPNRFADFMKVDAPDLQCNSTMSGVEVTLATLKNEAAISGDHVKYRLTKDENKKTLLKNKIEERGGKVDEYGISYPVKTTPMEYEAIQNAVVRKNDKLSSYKEKGYKEMGLFILYEEPLFPTWTEDKLKQLFEDAKGNPAYDVIYLYASGVLFTYRYKDKIIRKYSMPEEDHEALGTIARMTVDGEININCPIWTTYKEN